MLTKLIWTALISCLLIAAASPVVAQTLSSADIADAVGVALAEIRTTPEPNSPTVVVRSQNTPDYGPISISGRQAEVLTWDEARARQLAWFILLGPVRLTANGVQVVYSTPANGWGGHMDMQLDGSGWKIVDRYREHSSSGARYVYGEMYYQVECRNGSEMAKRQEIANEMMRLVAEKTLPLRQVLERIYDPKDYPGICTGQYFPEVNTYLELRKR